MVQTRKEQLDILNAYWRKVTFAATAGAASTTVAAATINAQSITDLTTGSTTSDPPTRGIITSGTLNFCQIRNADNRKPFDDDSVPIYARITFSSPNYVVTYYKKLAGAETATTLPGSGTINVEMIFPEVLTAGEVPADAHLVDEGGFAGGGAGSSEDDGYFIGVAPRHEEATVTINGQTAFSIADTPSDNSHVMMFINGVKQDYADEYTVSGTSITYTGSLTLQTTDVVEFFYFVVSDISGGGGGVTDHGDLSGLSDDDHLQYLLISGVRAMTGNLNMGNNNITNVGGSNAATAGSIRGTNLFSLQVRNAANSNNYALIQGTAANHVQIGDTTNSGVDISVPTSSVISFQVNSTTIAEIGNEYIRLGNTAFATAGTIRTENSCSWTARNVGNTGNLNVVAFGSGFLDIGDNGNTGGGATVHDGTQFEVSINSSIKLHVDASDMGVALPFVVGSSIANPATSASIDLQHTDRALLVNRLTTSNRNALTAANGMIIYNTTDNQLQGRINGSWVSLQGGVTDHGALTGLTDDDHTQYLLINGTRAMTGSLNMAGNEVNDCTRLDSTSTLDISADTGPIDFLIFGSSIMSLSASNIITSTPVTRANDTENTDVFLSPTHVSQGSGFNQGTSVSLSIVLTSGKDYDITITARVTDTSGNSVYKKSFYTSCYRTSGGTAAKDADSTAVETNSLFTCTTSVVGSSLIITLSNVTGGNNRIWNIRAGYNFGDMPNV